MLISCCVTLTELCRIESDISQHASGEHSHYSSWHVRVLRCARVNGLAVTIPGGVRGRVAVRQRRGAKWRRGLRPSPRCPLGPLLHLAHEPCVVTCRHRHRALHAPLRHARAYQIGVRSVSFQLELTIIQNQLLVLIMYYICGR